MIIQLNAIVNHGSREDELCPTHFDSIADKTRNGIGSCFNRRLNSRCRKCVKSSSGKRTKRRPLRVERYKVSTSAFSALAIRYGNRDSLHSAPCRISSGLIWKNSKVATGESSTRPRPVVAIWIVLGICDITPCACSAVKNET